MYSGRVDLAVTEMALLCFGEGIWDGQARAESYYSSMELLECESVPRLQQYGWYQPAGLRIVRGRRRQLL